MAGSRTHTEDLPSTTQDILQRVGAILLNDVQSVHLDLVKGSVAVQWDPQMNPEGLQDTIPDPSEILGMLLQRISVQPMTRELLKSVMGINPEAAGTVVAVLQLLSVSRHQAIGWVCRDVEAVRKWLGFSALVPMESLLGMPLYVCQAIPRSTELLLLGSRASGGSIRSVRAIYRIRMDSVDLDDGVAGEAGGETS